jgi:hypothetical protein
MQVVMQGTNSVAANSTINNVLTGEKYERAPANAYGFAYNTGSATGLLASLNVGGVAVSDTVNVGAANRTPLVPDDMLVGGWEAGEGDLIQLQVENTTGGALTYQWRIILWDGQGLAPANT